MCVDTRSKLFETPPLGIPRATRPLVTRDFRLREICASVLRSNKCTIFNYRLISCNERREMLFVTIIYTALRDIYRGRSNEKTNVILDRDARYVRMKISNFLTVVLIPMCEDELIPFCLVRDEQIKQLQAFFKLCTNEIARSVDYKSSKD